MEGEGIGVLQGTCLAQKQLDHPHIRSHRSSNFSDDRADSANRSGKSSEREDGLKDRSLKEMASVELKKDKNRHRTFHNERRHMATLKGPSADTSSSIAGRSTSDSDIVTVHEANLPVANVPRHESMVMARADLDLDKSSRTVFLANVSTLAIKSKKAKKKLIDHLASFNASLPENAGRHDIESLRFRSIAFASSRRPKKAAFVKKEIMESTTRSTNAYVVYTTELAARKAVASLNGSIVLDRHLRLDSVAHPAKIDHRRCVFVGNLGFVDDTNVKTPRNEDNRLSRKVKEPADIEEGLWRLFEKAGVVESVRIVRDKTSVGFFSEQQPLHKCDLSHETSCASTM